MNFHKIQIELAEIKMLISESEIVKREILPLADAVGYLKIKKSSLYKLTSSKKIPFYRPEGSKLIYFKRAELDAWMLKTRESTLDEIKENALSKR
ncbi:MAG: helix-turn-helix domain-containing protein [Chitinophagaceae bacterium]|nr:helix-turn-helix domain-containing protein [Chitinophagaceae bacterium]MCA6459029.1 helix-turn-helix domain-containing protein [Chitinophagaceae bacterium]MCA6465559.1 helix-turn-helix domain-containing protein [Chitinophagaceae bacterium]